MKNSIGWLGFVILCLALVDGTAQVKKPKPVPTGEKPTEPRLKPSQFPAPGAGTYLAGELVVIDPVNRRGGIRLDGDPNGRYHAGPLHYFALLPCGTVSHLGAPAELRDIPLGTHVHGYFTLPPEGDETIISTLPAEFARYEIPTNRAISLEDDVSFYRRQGRTWQIEGIDLKKGKLQVIAAGKEGKDGIQGKYTFDIDPVTRVWHKRGLVELDAIQPNMVVHFNLAWSQGWRDREFTVGELWLDEESLAAFRELQRRRHVRYEQQRWLPGWIDSVEPFDFGGGIMTLTLFGGRDASLYQDMKESKSTGFWVACAERSLRTWFHRGDRKLGQVLEWKETENPPPGSSGIQVKIKFTELLEGYRPGRCVRIKCDRWPFVTMPPEERVKSMEDQKRSLTLTLP
jgi:hypothetical protein